MKRPALPAAGFALIASALLCAPAWADWTLDPARSHLAFISIKAKDVAEVHTFNEIKGSISPDGQASIALMLDSVETLIPIRNERMREILFQTTDYKEAVLTAKIDPAAIKAIPPGAIATITAEGTLTLHGQTQPMTLLVQVAKVSDNTVMVASARPLVVDAAKFGLTDGVEKLREIAGLAAISNAVPVSFVLTFVDGGS